jgi:hypothetical protein
MPQNSAVTEETESTTDDENATEEISPPLWRAYELDVAKHAKKLDSNAKVEHDVELLGRRSNTNRQVDVLVTGTVAGENFTIAIECKRYSKKIGIGKVDEFAGKLEDLGVDRGILYSFNGLSAPARARADGASHPKISLGDLGGPTLEFPNWDKLFPGVRLPSFGDCPNVNCMSGDVEWRDWTQPSGEIITAGSCSACGTDAITCPTCGEKTDFVWPKQDCDGCERTFELHYDGGEIDGVSAL